MYQAIYLTDSTIAENIAFGFPKDLIDMEKVKLAARKAQIADFIESSPDGYLNTVGERGISLSGGQRQRIGIARALYRDAKLLVLDEATSALDFNTERNVMNSIFSLDPDLTIVMIAHRKTTLQLCNKILQIEGGKLVRKG